MQFFCDSHETVHTCTKNCGTNFRNFDFKILGDFFLNLDLGFWNSSSRTI